MGTWTKYNMVIMRKCLEKVIETLQWTLPFQADMGIYFRTDNVTHLLSSIGTKK